MHQLDPILKPRSIALVGASTKPNVIGSDIMKRLIEYGFQGNLYPVNPKADTIEGLKAYPSISALPETPDLAVLCINNKFVLDAVDECHKKGTKGLVIISAGFKETGPEGLALEQELARRLKEYGMRAVGPNCLGVVNTHPAVQMDATFAEALPRRGDIGFVSQSGALGGGILNILDDLSVGFAQFISIGNQADINAETAIEYWENEDDVKQILLYMESIANPQNFRNLATRTTKKKPVIALKSGRSAAGASAASSHTGSLAGADMAADALLKQSGVIRELGLADLFNTAKAFANCSIPQGDRICIVTNSGGPGIMATDAICEAGMQMAPITDETKAHLRSFLPAAASVKNPVDMIASAPLEHYEQTLEAVLQDPNVDMVMAIYLPFLGLKDIDVAKSMMKIKAKYPNKPLVGVFMTKSSFFTSLADMDVTVPFYMYVEEAVHAMKRLNQQRLWLARPEGKVPTFEVARDKVQARFEAVRAEGRLELSTRESLDVLDDYGIRISKSGFAETVDQAVEIADKIGYPVVMKMSSKTTSHKTDVGGVRVNIQSAEQLRAEYADLIEKLKAFNALDGLEGVVIQEMVKSNRELVLGLAADPQYGPMMMFGLGGVFVEVLKDVQFRLCPLTDVDAKELVHAGKAIELIEGARGTVPGDVAKIEETLLRLSQLVADFPEVVELDINPMMLSNTTGEAIAVDARIRLDK